MVYAVSCGPRSDDSSHRREINELPVVIAACHRGHRTGEQVTLRRRLASVPPNKAAEAPGHHVMTRLASHNISGMVGRHRVPAPGADAEDPELLHGELLLAQRPHRLGLARDRPQRLDALRTIDASQGDCSVELDPETHQLVADRGRQGGGPLESRR